MNNSEVRALSWAILLLAVLVGAFRLSAADTSEQLIAGAKKEGDEKTTVGGLPDAKRGGLRGICIGAGDDAKRNVEC